MRFSKPVFALTTALMTLIAAPACAEGDADAGLIFARDVCADCHAVEASVVMLSTNAPRSFLAIAENSRMTEMAIRVFLRSPHDQMPDFLLTAEQTDNIIAYFMKLKGER